MKPLRHATKPPSQKEQTAYRALWRIVDGAVADAFKQHPNYLASPEKVVRMSVNKRVVGAVLGYAAQASVGSARQPETVSRLKKARVWVSTALWRVSTSVTGRFSKGRSRGWRLRAGPEHPKPRSGGNHDHTGDDE